MALIAVGLTHSAMPDGTTKEYYSCFSDAATGTFTLPARDFRNVMVRVIETGNLLTAATAFYNMQTGVVSLASMRATVALTGVSGGVAGGSDFVATGGVIGTYASGDANIPANALITNVVGTAVSIDKALLGAVAAANINSHCVVEVTYIK